MITWPKGVQSCVLFTFDLDAETLWTSRDPKNWDNIQNMSRGAYGPREAIPRILKLLTKHDVTATFFIPGWVLEKYRKVAEAIHAQGHEIAYHGYLHEANPDRSYEEETALMEKCEAIIKDITGTRPVGHRSPDGVILPFTFSLLAERGYLYSANMMDSDIPYFHKVNGKEIPLVEFPSEWVLDDTSYYFYTLQEPERRGIAPPSAVLETWKEEFIGLHEEGKLFNLILHPQFSGRASRVRTLDSLLTYMKSCSGTWITRADEVARHLVKLKG